MSRRAYLALGSNIGDRSEHLRRAIQQLQERCGSVVQVSSVYETTPLPVPNIEQDNFYNVVVELLSPLDPPALLKEVLAIEAALGRDRSREMHWGPREIDIDIIAYSDQSTFSESPEIPHPRYQQRDFVLLPLKEIAPEFRDPYSQELVDIMLAKLSPNDRTSFRRISSSELFAATAETLALAGEA